MTIDNDVTDDFTDFATTNRRLFLGNKTCVLLPSGRVLRANVTPCQRG